MSVLFTVGSTLADGDFAVVDTHEDMTLGTVYRLRDIVGQTFRAVFVPEVSSSCGDVEKISGIKHPAVLEIHHVITADRGTLVVTDPPKPASWPNAFEDGEAFIDQAVSVLAHVHALGLFGFQFNPSIIKADTFNHAAIDLPALLLSRRSTNDAATGRREDCQNMAAWILGLDVSISPKTKQVLIKMAKSETRWTSGLAWHKARLLGQDGRSKGTKWAIPSGLAALVLLTLLGFQWVRESPIEAPLPEQAAAILKAPATDWVIQAPVDLTPDPTTAGFIISVKQGNPEFTRLNPWIKPNIRAIGLDATVIDGRPDIVETVKSALATSDAPPSLIMTVQELGVPLVEQIALIPQVARQKDYAQLSIQQRNTTANWTLSIASSKFADLSANTQIMNIQTIEALDTALEAAANQGNKMLQLTLRTATGQTRSASLPVERFLGPD